MRERKPSCYLKKYCTGYWGFEPTYAWIAYDDWRNEVARARLKRDCEKEARAKGYTPRQ